MNRWHLRISMFTACLVCSSFAWGLEYKADGTWNRTPAPNCCGDCVDYTCNICQGAHAGCGCGCTYGGFCGWCGRGKGLGWCVRNGGILPKCDHAQQWMNYYYGGGYGGGQGYGCGQGCGGGYAGVGAGGGQSWGGYNPDLFYNYYVPQTGGDGGVPADMYPSPNATPAPAIQTYYTYQPWMPHEHLYEHNRRYIRYHSGGLGATAVQVQWGNSPLRRHKY